MSKFKVGDRVRLIAEMDDRGPGCVGTVAEVCGPISADVEFDAPFDGWGDSGRRWNCDFNKLALAPRFAVGDKAMMPGWDKFYKVTRVSESQVWLEADSSGKSYPYSIDGLIKEEPIYSSCAAAEVDNLAAEYGAPKAKFKVGDRVRYTGKKGLGFYKTMMGKTGTVTKDDGGGRVGVDWDDMRQYGVYRDNIEQHVVAPATATLQIQAGKFYKTRDGRKALVGNNDNDVNYPFYHEVDVKSWHGVTREGKSCIGYRHCDLIAEWTDAPTTIADIVARHSQTGTAIVCLLENGQPKPATEPFVHGDAKAAEREALRLANIHKGKEFGVYTLGEVKKVERTFDHEWQRLAYAGRKIDAIKELRRMSGINLKPAKDGVENFLEYEAA